jgi:hypothetical protein
MKIQVLSLEEIEAPQSDAPANATDTGAADTGSTDTGAAAAPSAEPTEPVTQESAEADAAQSEALEAQFLVLEDLIQSWKAEGRLTPLMVVQANESLPSLRISHGHHTHEQRYSLAMEGVVNKSLELLKRFWAHLVEIWKKLTGFIKKTVQEAAEGKGEAAPVKEASVASALEIYSEVNNHMQKNLQMVKLHVPPGEDSQFVKAYLHAGGNRAEDAFNRIKKITPELDNFVQASEKHVVDLDAWLKKAGELQNEKLMMPKGPGETMQGFLAQAKQTSSFLNAMMGGHAVDPNQVGLLGPGQVQNLIKGAAFTTDPRELQVIEKLSEMVTAKAEGHDVELRKMASTDDFKSYLIYNKVGKELGQLRTHVVDAMTVVTGTSRLQRRILRVGQVFLEAVLRSYKDMTHEATAAKMSPKDNEFIKGEISYYEGAINKYAQSIGA